MMLAAALQMSLTFFIAATANSEEQTSFLERGYQGIVACNPDASREYTFDDLEGVYWYFGQYDRDHFIFSYFQGDLYEGEGIPKGMYGVSNDFSLIIKNVTDSDEGTYFYKVEPLLGRIYTGSVEVAVKVTTKQPFPVVPGCDPRPSVLADSCIVHDPYDIQTVSLTCELNHAKPPVDLQWFRVFDDGHREHIEATLTTKLLVHNPGLFFIDDTYTSLSSFHLLPTSDNITRYRCEAYGVALGDRNGSHVSVTVSKDAFLAHADQKVFLDRGRRGIIPCSPDAASAYQHGDVQGVYWYFRQRDWEHVIFSYFQGATVPLDGIPEGMYDVTSNFSLIIQNVTDSHEGTYYYVVESKVGQIDKGSVEVVFKDTTSETTNSSPPESTPTTMIVLVVMFGSLSLFFSIILLMLWIRHRRLRRRYTNHIFRTFWDRPSNDIATGSSEGLQLLHPIESPLSVHNQPQWETLASELGFSSDRIAHFKRLCPGQPDKQSWEMLSEWRGQGSSPRAQTTNLCHALSAIGRKDLAYELQGLNDRSLHKTSKGLDAAWEDLALELGLGKEELDKFKKTKLELREQAFEMLTRWRERKSSKEDGHEVLCKALDKINKKDLASQLRKDKNSFIDGIKRLLRVAYMLTLEPGSKELISREFLSPVDMIINNQEDLRSLRDDIREVGEPQDEPLRIPRLDVWCRSREDVDLFGEIIQSTNIDFSECIKLKCELSEKWKEELQSLAKAFQSEIKLPGINLTLSGRYTGDTGCDMGFVGKCLFDIKGRFRGKMGLSLSNMMRSHGDVESLVDSLKGCELDTFGCPGADLRGHVGLLGPLITASLDELLLSNCNLTDDDVSDLAGILPEGHGLWRLDIHRNKLSLDGISDITSHLTREHFPHLIRLDVYDMGLDAAEVIEVVEKNLPHLKEIEKGIFQLK